MDDLIPVPRYGWLYRVTFQCCGCRVLTPEVHLWSCPSCGELASPRTWETLRGG